MIGRHTIIVLTTLYLTLLQPLYLRGSSLSLSSLGLFVGSALYANSLLLVFYHLLRTAPPETDQRKV